MAAGTHACGPSRPRAGPSASTTGPSVVSTLPSTTRTTTTVLGSRTPPPKTSTSPRCISPSSPSVSRKTCSIVSASGCGHRGTWFTVIRYRCVPPSCVEALGGHRHSTQPRAADAPNRHPTSDSRASGQTFPRDTRLLPRISESALRPGRNHRPSGSLVTTDRADEKGRHTGPDDLKDLTHRCCWRSPRAERRQGLPAAPGGSRGCAATVSGVLRCMRVDEEARERRST